MTKKVPVKRDASNYQSRWENAVAIAETINAAIDKGLIVLDDKRQPVKRFTVTEDEIAIVEGNSSTVYFARDVELDMGMHTPICNYRAEFNNWIVIDPKNARSLLN
jgi:hypothetical protein